MNKQEHASLLRKLKPQTWYTFCQMESMFDTEEVKVTKSDLVPKLGISMPSLTKYLATWESHGMIRQVQGGYIIAQMDGQSSGITEGPVEREFRNARDIINYWCSIYEERYDRPL